MEKKVKISGIITMVLGCISFSWLIFDVVAFQFIRPKTLGGYTFYWNPDKMSIPEKKKVVAIERTYGGSAIFEWDAILEGTRVTLEWGYMPKGQYNALRERYLQTGVTFVWNPETGGNTYNVKIASLTGEYHEVVNHGGAWRQRVKMLLDIRSFASQSQATTTSTTSTTTTA